MVGLTGFTPVEARACVECGNINTSEWFCYIKAVMSTMGVPPSQTREPDMRNLRDTLDDIRTVLLCAARNFLNALRPDPLTEERKREISEFLKKDEARTANVPAYTAEELYAEFVKPLVVARPDLGKLYSRKSFHL